MKQLSSLKAKDLMLLFALILFASLAFNVFSPFFNVLILSLIIVQLFHPIYAFIKDKTKSNGLSTTLSIILVLVLFIVPIVLIVVFSINEVQNVIRSTGILDNLDSFKGFKDSIDQAVTYINNFSDNISKLDLQTLIAGVRQSDFLSNQLLPILKDLISIGGGILFSIFILILCLVYMFPAYEKLPRIVAKFSPLDAKYDEIIYRKFINTLKSVINGSFIVAIAQATVVIIPMIFLGVGAPVLLWIIMLILSIIPIGSGLVWAPIGAIMIIQGFVNQSPAGVIAGIFIIVYSGIMINVVDSILRPRLIKEDVNLHPLVTILSVIGGIGIFGFFGIFYGPLIIVILFTLLDIYKTNYLNKEALDEI
ncbi:MAG: AI-2E family transporter [Candidatus Dojkabacteria bacterium]